METSTTLPLPPRELRALIGPLDDALFDNPSGAPVFPDLPLAACRSVLDWGCGCGRVARQLIQQRPRPERYLGIDLHRGMVRWCQQNLAPHAPGFRFEHHDVHAAGLNPEGSRDPLPFPLDRGAATLIVAWSVFTHVTQRWAEHYLDEAARVLAPDGFLYSTWFLFEKADFPMMQEWQNALYINEIDPSNAVLFDRSWLRDRARAAGLKPTRVVPPEVRGFQWRVVFQPLGVAEPEAEFPPDLAAVGIQRPPLMPADAPRLGLDE